MLERRGGAVLSRRSILKTASPRPADVEPNALALPGVADIKCVVVCVLCQKLATWLTTWVSLKVA